jgi:non-heme chloroperoxidase
MPFVRARDGEKLHVRVLGRGAPCLLLHGFASDSYSWLPFVAPLAHRYRFYLPDLRGFGLSRKAKLRHACPLTTYAEDLQDIVEQLRLSDLPLGGISMGAFTAVQSFKLFGRSRFSRYLHVDQGPVIRNHAGYEHGLLGARQAEFFGRLERLLARVQRGTEDGSLDLVYDRLPADMRREFASVFAEFMLAAFAGESLRALLRPLVGREAVVERLMPQEGLVTYLQIMRAYLEQDYDLRPAFRTISVPMTVIIGGASRMYPAAGQRAIAQLVPHASLREIAGAGHVVPLEAPVRFVSELRAFLDATH